GCEEVRIAPSIRLVPPAPRWFAGACFCTFARMGATVISYLSSARSPADDGRDRFSAEPLLKAPVPKVLHHGLSSQRRCFEGRTVGVPGSFLLTIGGRFGRARRIRPGLTDEAHLSPHPDFSHAIGTTLRVLSRLIDQGRHALGRGGEGGLSSGWGHGAEIPTRAWQRILLLSEHQR